ncbi:MAG: HAMP domain-containing protein [Bryobacteraceae bacterium]|nr:HAMP domain-containing protein [Bryobacteraceae bacterium]
MAPAAGGPRISVAGKLAVLLVAAVLACFGIYGFFQQRLEQRHLEALVLLSAERVADIVHFSAYDAMLKNDRERLYTLIRDIGKEPGIQRLRIINEDGQVQHSTEESETGTMVDKSAEACYACHAQAQPLTKLAQRDRARIFRNAGGQRTLAVIRPIENQPECSNAACHAHPPSRRILGVIDAHLDLSGVDRQLAEHRNSMALFTVASAAVMSVLSLLFVWLVVHRPMRELFAATVMLARGETTHRIHVHTRDEFGILGRSFNAMAAEIHRTHAKLREWADTLESRVQQKTEELETAHRGMLNSEKMASLGRLAATVAHEVNNPLFGMLTYARLTLKDIDRLEVDEKTKARMRENVELIERESRRCGDLMKNLLAFSRQKAPQLTPVNVNTVVRQAARLMLHQFDLNQIEFAEQLADDLPEIQGDQAQIQQVLIILLANASEAIGQGGEIRVRTAAAPGGEGVRIEVRDNGPGIAPDVIGKIFEPFFSTKEHQHRTGLGLAVAKGIVDRHGGVLRVESEPGEGAAFMVELPVRLPAALAAQREGETA